MHTTLNHSSSRRPRTPNSMRALANADVLVRKIGGDNAGKLRENYRNLTQENQREKKQVVVFSAIRSSDKAHDHYRRPTVVDLDVQKKPKPGFNTTSHLIHIARCVRKGDLAEAYATLEVVRNFTKEIVAKEIAADTDLSDQTNTKEAINAAIDRLLGTADNAAHYPYSLYAHIARAGAQKRTRKEVVNFGEDWLFNDPNGERYFSFTGVGETLAQQIYGVYFAEKNLSTTALDTTDLSNDIFDGNIGDTLDERIERTKIDRLRRTVRNRIDACLNDADIITVSGYLPVIGSKRGYSDKTGALCAQALKKLDKKVLYVIEKASPIRSADPRQVESETAVIRLMTYLLAGELFGARSGADAGAIHPDAVAMLQEYDIDTVVMNPSQPKVEEMTLITNRYKPAIDGVQIIASRAIPAAYEIQSSNMTMREGVIATLTAWFREQKISIDQTPSSETSITLTFNGQLPPSLERKFRAFVRHTYGASYKVTKKENLALVFCLGNNIAQTDQLLRAGLGFRLVDATLHGFTKGFNPSVMTFLIDCTDVSDAVRKLHDIFIAKKNDYDRVIEETQRQCAMIP